AALAAQPARSRLGKVLGDKPYLAARMHAAVAAQPDLASAADQAGTQAAEDHRRAISLITGGPTANLRDDKLAMPWAPPPARAAHPVPVTLGPGTPTRADYLESTRLNPLAPTHTSILSKIAMASPVQAMGSIKIVAQPYIPVPSYQFCIPVNPTLRALRLHAE